MSLWVCVEHGLYGGDVFCPDCGATGHFAALATDLGIAPASAIEAATAGETVKQGSTEGESAVAESQTPNSSGDRV